MADSLQAEFDEALSATVVDSWTLLYDDGPDRPLDRPAHVRAASGVTWLGDRLAIVQDDAHFLALVKPGGSVSALALPAGDGGERLFDDGRGNKMEKMDLEACCTLTRPGGAWLVAFGSGSTPKRRQLIAVREDAQGELWSRVFDATPLYLALGASKEFCGDSLNIEGVAVLPGGWLRFFQRNNGAARAEDGSTGAVADVSLDWMQALLNGDDVGPPVLHGVTRYGLGMVGGVPLCFTDAWALPDGEVYYLAAAEDSPDAIQDGPVTGSAIGWIGGDGRARQTLLRDEQGEVLREKVEGLCLDPHEAGVAWVLTDPDEAETPSRLLKVKLSGKWPV